MQLEQQETFTIHGPQLEILGEVETKLPAPAKKRGVALSTILSAWLRCKEHAAVPFWASLGAVAANTGLNYLLIFGKLGFAPMGVQGAAIATLVSQLLNSLLILLGFAVCLRRDGSHPQWALHFERITLWAYGGMILPILLSEFLWSLGQNVESAVYGHLGTANLAA